MRPSRTSAPQIDRPRFRVAGRNHIDVPDQQDPSTAAAAQPADDDRQIDPGHLRAWPVRIVASKGSRIRLEALGL